MKTVVLLAVAFTALIVAPTNSADTYVKAEKSQESSASAASESASSEQQIKANTGNGEYEARSKQESSKASAQTSQSSKESYEARTSGGGSCGGDVRSVEETEKSEKQSRLAAAKASNNQSEEIKKRRSGCGCGKKEAKAITKTRSPCQKCKSIKAKKDLIKSKGCGCAQRSKEEATRSPCQKCKRVKAKKDLIKSKGCGCAQRKQEAKKIKTEEEQSKHQLSQKASCLHKQKKDVNVKKAEHDENLKKWVASNYKQNNGEDLEMYFKRITCKEGISNDEYIKRLTIARSMFSSLDLWYCHTYFPLIKQYYSLLYSKKADESEDSFFKRLMTKENFESQENWAKRVNLLHELYPSLKLWSDGNCYSQYSKHFFETFYKKAQSESTDSYLKRVFRKVNGESDRCFWKRVKLIQNTFPKYNCWYNKENLKKVDACKSFSKVQNEEELKKEVESQKSSDCNKDKIGVLQTFFKSSKSSSQSSSSSSSSEETVTVRGSC